VGRDGRGDKGVSTKSRSEKFLRIGLDMKFGDLPVGQQIAKPIAIVQNMMGIASFYPFYALILYPKLARPLFLFVLLFEKWQKPA
jgi:hypothetical protein